MKIENRVIKTELVEWQTLIPLQPKNFKELTKANYEKLKQSILKNNFVMTFTAWDSGKGTYIIDGVHRYKVLDLLESEGVDVPKKLPCTFIKCKDKKEASQNKTYPCIGNGEKLCQVEIMRWAKPHQSKIQKQY